jgi:hypothetical protein
MASLGARRWFAVVALLLAGTASAAPAERKFGAWTVGFMSGKEAGVFAATINDSGGLLGQYCYKSEEKCLWLLANDINCEDGNQYAVLVNADTGAASAQIYCLKIEGKPRYVFVDFDLIDGIVRKATWFGIAFPMANGRFQVSRFALEGAAKAIAYMRSAAEGMVDKASRSTKDQTF